MARNRTVYICRVCHLVGERPLTCHPGKSVECDAGVAGDESSRPLFDEHGHLVTRAPKWWVDACFKEKGKRYTGKQVHR
ncbi:MAG: hypothetical protein HY782_02060 [Chloroflexi bacterium]|nr:hypothetical protein [Chloroflexota bacterium]